MALGDEGSFRRRRWRVGALHRLVDLMSVGVGWSVALLLLPITADSERTGLRSLTMVFVAMAATVALCERRSVYEQCPRLPRVDETARTATSVLGGATVMALFCALSDTHIGGRELLAGVLVVTLLVFAARGYGRAWRVRPGAERRMERIVIIGAGDEAKELAQLVDEHPDSGFELLGIAGDESVAERHGMGHLWLGPASRAAELLHLHQADSAVVNATGFRGQQFREITRQLLSAGFDVRVSTGITRLYRGRFQVTSLVHEPLVSIVPQRVPAWQLFVKRGADIVGASLVLLLVAPVMLLTALAIKLEDGGEVLFRQKRTGMGGAPFLMMKFRSMVPDAESRRAELEDQNERTGPLFKVSQDPRVTRIGSFIRESSIDELPQLINVLRGDMSLVGPRPPLPDEQARFDEELQGRFNVRPGITGLWQVEARSNASFNAYRRLDLHYVENWSLWMDLRILLATAEQVLVAVATAPLRRLLGHTGSDQVAPPLAAVDSEVLIDLRTPRRSPALTSWHTAVATQIRQAD